MSGPDLDAIATRYGGKIIGNECRIPTPGHSSRDRGTVIRLVPDAPDGFLVNCFNGGRAEALAVKDMVRSDGFVPALVRNRQHFTQAQSEANRKAAIARNAERLAKQDEAAKVARQKLEQSNLADQGHPYLSRKRIAPERLWQSGNWLLVPMTDIEGSLWNIQTIRPNGEKRFLAGGRTKGVFWWEGQPDARLVIGEGVATVAAVRRATGLPVVAAMSAGNLPDVAAMIHSKQPDLELIIAADDDKAGIEAARLASQRTGALIALPGEISNG
jgi:phage/plasmid primase-like uncharacterized protein